MDAKELYIHYGSPTAEAMFDFPCEFFRIPECVGAIAYRVEYNCAVIFGDPICPPEETFKLTEAFHQYCQKLYKNIIYITVSKEFTDRVRSQYGSVSLEICEEFNFDLNVDPRHTSHRLQHRVDKAKKHGLTVHEYIPYDEGIEKQLKEIALQWQQSIKGMHIYLGHLDFFEDYDGKRWFYVKDGEKITSMLMLRRIESKDGWLLKFFVTSPGAFHDTSEFLMISVLEILKNENCRFLTKGAMPVDALGEVKGLGSFSIRVVRKVYQIIGWFFKFKKRKEYWLRYHPQKVPSYVVLVHPHLGLSELRALMKVCKTG